MTTRIYPLFKDLAREIAGEDRIFYPDTELVEKLKEKPESDAYRFALMGLKDQLLHEYQVDFIRSENEELGKGYKKATPQESIEISVELRQRKIRNQIHRQRRILDTIDRVQLSSQLSEDYDRKVIRNGMMLSFFNKIPLSKCLPGSNVRVDVPKLIE